MTEEFFGPMSLDEAPRTRPWFELRELPAVGDAVHVRRDDTGRLLRVSVREVRAVDGDARAVRLDGDHDVWFRWDDHERAFVHDTGMSRQLTLVRARGTGDEAVYLALRRPGGQGSLMLVLVDARGELVDRPNLLLFRPHGEVTRCLYPNEDAARRAGLELEGRRVLVRDA